MNEIFSTMIFGVMVLSVVIVVVVYVHTIFETNRYIKESTKYRKQSDELYNTIKESNIKAELQFQAFVTKYTEVYNTLVEIKDLLNKGIEEDDKESLEQVVQYLNESLEEDLK